MGAGVLRLPNAEVIVDNGVLRTAADAGLSRIWVEIYSGGKMGGRVEKVGEVRARGSEGGGGEGDVEVRGERGVCLGLSQKKVRSRRRGSKKKKIEMALSSCRKKRRD